MLESSQQVSDFEPEVQENMKAKLEGKYQFEWIRQKSISQDNKINI